MTGARSETARPVRSERTHHPAGPARPATDPVRGSQLPVRMEVRLVGGEAGRALAAAQGRALSALLASLGEVEVEGGEEVLP
jgi:hypothetical protein